MFNSLEELFCEFRLWTLYWIKNGLLSGIKNLMIEDAPFLIKIDLVEVIHVELANERAQIFVPVIPG